MWIATPKYRRGFIARGLKTMGNLVGESMFQSAEGNVLQLSGGAVQMSQSVDGNTPIFRAAEGNFQMPSMVFH